jgi:uncharacterized protein (DUF697 family)
MSDDAIATKLISIAARNAALIGGTAGAAVSADEIATLASLGFTLPGNVAIAIGAVGIEIVSVTNIQLRLIASLAGLYGEPLDPDDPEDILLVIKYFLLGKTSDVVQVGGTKVGQGLARTTVKVVFSREMLKAVQDYGKKAGLKILQKTLVNVAVPVVSIGLSASSNYVFTRTLGRKAGKDMKARAGEIARHKTDIVPPMPLIEDLPTVY